MDQYECMKEEQMRNELRLRDAMERERKESDRKYAIKIVERIVFGLVVLLLSGVIAAILRAVLK